MTVISRSIDRRLDRPGLLPLGRAGLSTRLQLTGVAAGYFLAAVPALLLFILTIVSLSVSVVIVGAVALLGLVPLLALFTRAHRNVTGALAGREVPAGYAPAPGDPFRRLIGWARDPVRWRDFAFTAFAITGGWALTLAVLSLAALPFSLVIQPFLSRSPAWRLLWLLVPLAAALWWVLTPILTWVRIDVEAYILGGSATEALERRVAQVDQARTATLDHSAAELRRIERDLHDGAQARMVSLGMNIGLAEELLRTDPAAAAELLREARTTNLSALEDLRSVVRGIHPPVLADRGLVGAVQALALDLALPVLVTGSLPGPAPAPVESAAYFAVAECLANVVKHAGASQAVVGISHSSSRLRVTVQDDGRGGADLSAGTGLAGIAARLGTFDGRMLVDSPPGGPTVVTLEVPCGLSSPRTSPS